MHISSDAIVPENNWKCPDTNKWKNDETTANAYIVKHTIHTCYKNVLPMQSTHTHTHTTTQMKLKMIFAFGIICFSLNRSVCLTIRMACRAHTHKHTHTEANTNKNKTSLLQYNLVLRLQGYKWKIIASLFMTEAKLKKAWRGGEVDSEKETQRIWDKDRANKKLPIKYTENGWYERARASQRKQSHLPILHVTDTLMQMWKKWNATNGTTLWLCLNLFHVRLIQLAEFGRKPCAYKWKQFNGIVGWFFFVCRSFHISTIWICLWKWKTEPQEVEKLRNKEKYNFIENKEEKGREGEG